MSHWNHRVLAHQDGDDVYFSIHEVYYDGERPSAYTKEPIGVGGNNLDELKWVLDKMNECLSKPILWAGERWSEEYKPEILEI